MIGAAPRKPKSKRPPRVRLCCMECGRRWLVSADANDPQCPSCNGVDWEVASRLEVAS